MQNADGAAWIEDIAGNRVPIRGSLSIGRSASNQLTLPDEKVSRRHAVIQGQGEGEFWLADFGSRNGTYLNGRRLSHPTRLQHGDLLRVGPFELVFRQPDASPRCTTTILAHQTVTEILQVSCWLLVADIMDSTKLAKELPADELPRVTGEWLGECKLTIESSGGRINQFMGDGFFAYWRDRDRAEVQVAEALRALRRLQDGGRLAFRYVLHHGSVVIGGAALGEEERISGPEVHYVFRVEKLAGRLKRARLLSEPAWERLAGVLEAEEAGVHTPDGFECPARFFTF